MDERLERAERVCRALKERELVSLGYELGQLGITREQRMEADREVLRALRAWEAGDADDNPPIPPLNIWTCLPGGKYDRA